jgi:hypothetical protein
MYENKKVGQKYAANKYNFNQSDCSTCGLRALHHGGHVKENL